MSIGSRLKLRREELGLTQTELAKLVGVSKGSIGNYESEISSPNENILIKLFSALDCDANYLYHDDINKSNDSISNTEILKNPVKNLWIDIDTLCITFHAMNTTQIASPCSFKGQKAYR